MELHEPQTDLFEVVFTLNPRGRLATLCTAGIKSATRTAMMAMTTSNSIRVNPRRVRGIPSNNAGRMRASFCHKSPKVEMRKPIFKVSASRSQYNKKKQKRQAPRLPGSVGSMLSWPTTYRGLKGVERSEKMACFDHRSRQAFDRDREAGTVHERYGRDQIETCSNLRPAERGGDRNTASAGQLAAPGTERKAVSFQKVSGERIKMAKKR